MKATILRDSYFLVNISFITIILAIFGYSLLFGASGRKYPLPSGSVMITGKPSVSTGLSRSFSALMRFDIEQAQSYNRHGIRIFLFFLIQLVMRSGALVLSIYSATGRKNHIVRFDVLISLLLFILLFWPFLSAFTKSITGHS